MGESPEECGSPLSPQWNEKIPGGMGESLWELGESPKWCGGIGEFRESSEEWGESQKWFGEMVGVPGESFGGFFSSGGHVAFLATEFFMIRLFPHGFSWESFACVMASVEIRAKAMFHHTRSTITFPLPRKVEPRP